MVAAADAAILKKLAAKHTRISAREFRLTVEGVLECSQALTARADELGTS